MIQGVLKKVKDTGTNDPFNARLLFGVMKLRDHVVKDDKERLVFDKLYQPVFENLEETQEYMNKCISLINSHKNKVNSGEITGFQGEVIEVRETIDRDLNKNFKDFFIKGNIALKALSPLSKHLGYHISFFFQDEKKFKAGKEKFLKLYNTEGVKEFTKMLDKDRNGWYQYFNTARDKIEHEGFSLPDIKYAKIASGKVKALFPTVDNCQIPDFLQLIWNNLFEFVEDVAVSLISFNLKSPLIIRIIPEEQRDKSLPLKYDIWTEGLTEFLQKETKKKNND